MTTLTPLQRPAKWLLPDANNHAERIAWLRLIRTKGVGSVTFLKLMRKYGNAQNAVRSLPLHLKPKQTADDVICSLNDAENELAELRQAGGDLLLISDPNYPPFLAHIHAPPPVLSYFGNDEICIRPGLAIVGSRNCSTAGKRMAFRCASNAGENNYMVVSGLAIGVDSVAHTASLKTGTVALMAGGLSQIYPEQNRKLFQDIIDNGGCIISEHPFLHRQRAADFVRRNRLIAGMALAVLIIEARMNSGSMTTVKYALEEGRTIMAVPGFPLDPKSAGGNHLIKQGAEIITCPEDVSEILNPMAASPEAILKPSHLNIFKGLEEDSSDIILGEEPADFAETFYPPADSDQPLPPQANRKGTDKTTALIIAALSTTPETIDNLIESTGLPAYQIQRALTELSITNKIEYLPQGKIIKSLPQSKNFFD